MFRFPAYPKKAHQSGQARIVVNKKSIYLGRYGSQESKDAYAALAKRHADGLPSMSADGCTIGALIAAFLISAEKEKTPKEQAHYRRALTAVSRVVGPDTLASAFNVSSLDRVRSALIAGSCWTPEEKTKRHGPWSRGVVNLAMVRLRHVWRWAETQGLVPPGAWEHLRSLRPIPKTNRAVRQTKPRQGIEQPALEAILPHLPAMVQAMAELQWWMGLRPCETVKMKAGDIVDIDGQALYRIDDGKNSWREGAEAEYAVIGPEAWRVLEPWLRAAKLRGDDAPLFPTGRPSESPHYNTDSYARAVKRAFDAHPDLTPWTPYQLRHGAKRRIKRALGLDAARAVLRQRSLTTTERYDRGQDLDIATRAAKEAG